MVALRGRENRALGARVSWVREKLGGTSSASGKEKRKTQEK